MLKNIIDHNAEATPSSDFLNELRQHFPQLFDRDGAFNADKFKAALADNNVTEARDGYRLSFVGKDYARLQTGWASETLIAPDTAHNSQPENGNSQNIFITGDNLEALRHLQNAYQGKVKMIYIDPPYNTGKEFVYNDRFEFDDQKLKSALGYSDEDIERLKSIQGKSSHSAWLTFMYPRLKLAQKLLTEDGVIFVSIDDNEQANLKLLMDEVFGEGNFAACIPWQSRLSIQNDTDLSINHEYLIAYARKRRTENRRLKENNANIWHNCNSFVFRPLPLDKDNFDNPDNDPRGLWKADPFDAPNIRPNLTYPILNPNTGEQHLPPSGRCWRISLEKFTSAFADKRIIFGKNGTSRPQMKSFYEEKKDFGTIDNSWFSGEKIGTTTAATKELQSLFGNIPFDTPKPTTLIKKLCTIGFFKENDIILDFFAGSATTAHAVMQLNAEDNGNRKFIMVQWDEPTNPDSEARKAGYHTIDEISRERIKRAAAKIKSENPMFAGDLDLGFKHYRLTTPTSATIDRIMEFNPEQADLFGTDMITKLGGLDTLLTTWLIDGGNTFDTPIEEIALSKYTAHYIADSKTLYLINEEFNTEVLKDMLNQIGKGELAVSTIVVYPYSFGFGMMQELELGIKSLDNAPQLIRNY